MLKSTNPTAIKSQEWILESLLNLLSEISYSQITVLQICKRADLDRRTFYRNFGSKDDVLNFYITRLKDEYVEMLSQKDTLDTYTIALTYFQFWQKHIEFIKSMNSDGRAFFLLSKHDELLSGIHNMFYTQSMGEFAEYRLVFNAGGFWNLLIKWVSSDMKKTPQEMATIISSILKIS